MKHSTTWLNARVQRIIPLSPTVSEFEIAADEGFEPWAPGAHLGVRVRLGAVVDDRSYSLVGAPDAGVWRIAVKRLATSRGGSQYMHGLQAGDALEVQPPNNHFELPPGTAPTLLLAGGIGITPLLQMARVLAARGAPLRLAYAARSAAELVYADALREELGDRLATFAGDRGERLDVAAEVAALPAEAQALVCGPLPLLRAVQQAWGQAGRPATSLRFETFGAGGARPAQPFRVKLPRHGLDLVVPAGRSLLDTLAEHGVELLWDCRRGECGLCAIDVLACEAGEIDHRDVFFSPAEQRAGERLCACVSRAAGAGATLVLDSPWRADTAAANEAGHAAAR